MAKYNDESSGYIDKKRLIEMIESKYGDEDYFRIEQEMLRPDDDSPALIGCEFGSAQHMTRKKTISQENEIIHIFATRVVRCN